MCAYRLSIALLVASVRTGDALKISRRALGGAIPAAAAALAPCAASAKGIGTVFAMAAASDPGRSPFQGYFVDPNHVKGYRIVTANVDAGSLSVVGRDGPDEPEFALKGIIQSQFSAAIDFSPKGGPAALQCTFRLVEGRPIVEFPDGNGWARLSEKPEMLKAVAPMGDDRRSGLAKIGSALGGGGKKEKAPSSEKGGGFGLPKMKLPFS